MKKSSEKYRKNDLMERKVGSSVLLVVINRKTPKKLKDGIERRKNNGKKSSKE
jgi:hypothetical protein